MRRNFYCVKVISPQLYNYSLGYSVNPDFMVYLVYIETVQCLGFVHLFDIQRTDQLYPSFTEFLPRRKSYDKSMCNILLIHLSLFIFGT